MQFDRQGVGTCVNRRDRLTVLLDRALHLHREDSDLLHAVFHDGISIASLARGAGQSPRTLQRTVRRLLQRLTSREFRLVQAQQHLWPPLRARIAAAVFMQGDPLREAASRTGASLHRVRTEIAWVRGQCDLQRIATEAMFDASTTIKRNRSVQEQATVSRASRTLQTSRPSRLAFPSIPHQQQRQSA